ncbi:hypothetical protein ACFY7H_11485 [Streptomyces sp. NPDC012794]|uniref:hypothetical protein n=1 Tax=Streptomyces sp. NPDC012794 TaxID=3364850 RepID=UPI0036B336AD
MRDAETVVAGSEIVVECPGLTHHHTGDTPVPLRLRRRIADGTWIFEVGTPVAQVPLLAGTAREQDVRDLALGILDVLETDGGEPDFRLYDDGYTEVRATVGYGPELYLALEATFDLDRDRAGTDPNGSPRYANPFGWCFAELGGIPVAEPEALGGFARALLAALDG